MRLGMGWEFSQPHVTRTPIFLIQGDVFPMITLDLVHTHSSLIYTFRILRDISMPGVDIALALFLLLMLLLSFPSLFYP